MQFKEAGQYILSKLSNELPAHLTYHNIAHVNDVYSSASGLAKGEGITEHETQLLLTAALYHDAGFVKGPHQHEEESCRIARHTLPAFNYSSEEIDCICGMIMATRVPQTPNTHLEQILADADLDYLGRYDFFIIGDKLYHELLTLGSVNTRMEWNRLQISFLESHTYFTTTAITLRNGKKQQHLQSIKLNTAIYR